MDRLIPILQLVSILLDLLRKIVYEAQQRKKTHETPSNDQKNFPESIQEKHRHQ